MYYIFSLTHAFDCTTLPPHKQDGEQMPRSYLITKSEYQLFDEALEALKDLIKHGAASENDLRAVLSKLQLIYPAPLASGFIIANGEKA